MSLAALKWRTLIDGHHWAWVPWLRVLKGVQAYFHYVIPCQNKTVLLFVRSEIVHRLSLLPPAIHFRSKIICVHGELRWACWERFLPINPFDGSLKRLLGLSELSESRIDHSLISLLLQPHLITALNCILAGGSFWSYMLGLLYLWSYNPRLERFMTAMRATKILMIQFLIDLLVQFA